MKKFYFILLLFVFFVQFSFLPMFSFDFQLPNLILIIVTVIGIKRGLIENLAWFFLAGFLFEIFSLDFFGFNLILFILTGWLAWLFRNIILNKENNILIEAFSWFLVKIFFDLFYQLEIFMIKLTGDSVDQYSLKLFSVNYPKETLLFVLSALIIAMICNYFQKKASFLFSGPKLNNFIQ